MCVFKMGFKTTVNAAAGIASDMSTRAEFVDARQKSNTEVIFLGRIRYANSLFARNYSDIRSGLVPTSMNHEHACRYWQEYHVAGSFAETLYSLSLTNNRTSGWYRATLNLAAYATDALLLLCNIRHGCMSTFLRGANEQWMNTVEM